MVLVPVALLVAYILTSLMGPTPTADAIRRLILYGVIVAGASVVGLLVIWLVARESLSEKGWKW